MINSEIGFLGLIGNPVEHSLSPVFMNYILEKLGINYRYSALKVDENELKIAIDGIRSLGFRGLNVTIPFKKKVVNYIDQLDEDAERIGAVNCILNDNNKLKGFNTDYRGFIWPIRDYKDLIKGSNVLILGCGGAARGVVYSLSRLKINSIQIVNRSEDNAREFIKWARSIFDPETKIEYIGNSQSVDSSLLKYILLIINTTPLGMSPNIEESPLNQNISFYKTNIVYDLIYNPLETKLLKRAKECGAKTINGFPMLIAQGIYSLSYWFPEVKEEAFSLYDEAVSSTEKYMSEFK